MRKVYIAAPLFNESERKLNEDIDNILTQELGLETYLPQRDGGEAAIEMNNIMEEWHPGIGKDAALYTLRQDIFYKDVEAIKSCDFMVAVLDGRVPDEGTCIEIGMAYMLKKPVIAYRTDDRSFIQGFMNIMLEMSCLEIVNSMHALTDAVEELVDSY